MRAAMWKKKNVLEIDDIPEQEVGPEDVKIKVEYTAICGSDPHIISGKLPVSYPPRIMGHEMYGTVIELGEEAKTKCLKLAVFFPPGTMAESVVWHEQQVFKLPDSVSFEEGCLAEPVSVCMRGIDLSDIREGSSVAILGLGGIGQILLQLALLAGASKVMVADPVESKRNIALEMGADLAFDPLSEDMWATTMKVTGNRGFDTVIEASGNLDSAKSAMDMVGKAGTMVYFAVYPMNFELPIKPFDLYSREITVRGLFMSPYLFPRTMAILPKLNLKPLISRVFPLSQVKDAFEEQERGQGIKILVKSSEE